MIKKVSQKSDKRAVNKNVAIVIPAYNEGSSIRKVVDGIPKEFNVVVVDDGSSDDTYSQISKTRAKPVRHPINLGQGAALQTGIEVAAADSNNEYFVTFDADGQHQIKDVISMLKHIRADKNLDIVLGSRFLGKAENISFLKKYMLKLAIKFSNLSSGVKLTDAHNGLRVFNRKVAEGLNIQMADFAHASEIVERIAERKWAYKELPVTIVYTDYSRSKGQSVINSINIAFDILLNKIIKR